MCSQFPDGFGCREMENCRDNPCLSRPSDRSFLDCYDFQPLQVGNSSGWRVRCSAKTSQSGGGEGK